MSDSTPITQHDLDTITQSIEKLKQTPEQFRNINTFVKRRTHIGQNAHNALLQHSDIYVNPAPLGKLGDISGITDLSALFNTPRPLVLEIGFGMGQSLHQMAKDSPDKNFVGIEVHEPGIGNLVHLATYDHLDNLKVINGDAVALLQNLPCGHVDIVQLFFPDPWQKKRHYKRRFVTYERMLLVQKVLKTGGIFHAATDWQHYALWMVNVLNTMDGFKNCAKNGNFVPKPTSRPMTKFENRGIDKGHGVWDIMYQKYA